VIALRKNLTQSRGENALLDEIRYFFYITTRTDLTPAEVVACANDRCDQENVIEQLKNGVLRSKRVHAVSSRASARRWAEQVDFIFGMDANAALRTRSKWAVREKSGSPRRHTRCACGSTRSMALSIHAAAPQWLG
jgi:hypothetical protein